MVWPCRCIQIQNRWREFEFSGWLENYSAIQTLKCGAFTLTAV